MLDLLGEDAIYGTRLKFIVYLKLKLNGASVFYLATLQMRERGGRSRGERKEGDGLIFLEACGSTGTVGQGAPRSGWPSVGGAGWRRRAALPLPPRERLPHCSRFRRRMRGGPFAPLKLRRL